MFIFSDDQNIPAIVPQYLNFTEEKQSLVVRVAEDFNSSIILATEKTNSPLAENENQTIDAICGDSKSSSETPESSVVGSPDTESPVLVNEYVRSAFDF